MRHFTVSPHQRSISQHARTAIRCGLGALLLTTSLFSHANLSTIKAPTAVQAEVLIAIEQTNLDEQWQTLLSQHVKPINNGHSTAVDYAAIKEQRQILQTYLDNLSKVTRTEFDAWGNTQQLAFLINAYNAWTVEFILTKYPDIKSIKELGSFFSSPWSKEFIPLLGKKRSLDNIEHDLIRGSGRYNDPRIHFAVNCASIGCPALREEVYTANKLDQQLTEQTKRFLSDSSRNHVQANAVYLSSIFKWYDDDFEAGFRGAKSIEAFLLLYAESLKLTEDQQSALQKGNMKIKYLDYNWKLNSSD